MSQAHQHLRKFCLYTRNINGKSERWVQTLNFELSAFLKETGIEQVTAISREAIEDYIIDQRRTREWSNQTVRNRLISMRTFMKWCIDQGLIADNPCLAIPLPKPKPKPRESLSEADALSLLHWTKSYRYQSDLERLRSIAIIGMFMYAGLRLSELRSLDRDDIKWDLKLIYVRSGKGDKYRIVPIIDQLTPLLKPYMDACESQRCHCPAFFVALRSDKRMSVSVIPRLVEKLRASSGIYFYPHMLRHTFATMMLMGGASLKAIKEAMGHSDVRTTEIYLTITPDYLRSEMSKCALDPTKGPTRQRFV